MFPERELCQYLSCAFSCSPNWLKQEEAKLERQEGKPFGLVSVKLKENGLESFLSSLAFKYLKTVLRNEPRYLGSWQIAIVGIIESFSCAFGI